MTVCTRQVPRLPMEVPPSPFTEGTKCLGDFEHGDWVRCSFSGAVSIAQVDFTINPRYVETGEYVPLRQRLRLQNRRSGRDITWGAGDGGFSPSGLELICRPSVEEEHR